MLKVQFSLYVFFRAVNILLSFIGVYILTRVLNPDEYGIYTLILSGIFLLSSISFEWISVSISRFYSSRQKEVVSLSIKYFLKISVSLGVLALIVMLLMEFGVLENKHHLIVSLGLISILSSGLFSISLQMFNSSGRAITYNTLLLFRQVLLIITVYLFAIIEAKPFYFLIAIIVSTLIPAFILLIKYRKDFNLFTKWVQRDFSKLEFVKYGVPMSFLFAATVIIDSSDKFMIAYFLDAERTAIYSASYDLIQKFVGVFLGVVYLAYFPKVISEWNSGNIKESKLILYNMSQILIWIGIFSFTIVNVIYFEMATLIGEGLRHNSSMLVLTISLSILIGSIKGYVFDVDYMLRKNVATLIKIVAFMALLNLLLNLFLIELFGILGAAYSTLVAFSVGLFLSYKASSRIINFRKILLLFGRLSIAMILIIGGLLLSLHYVSLEGVWTGVAYKVSFIAIFFFSLSYSFRGNPCVRI
jgi:O-antigen/teichoic acid export membrane protein